MVWDGPPGTPSSGLPVQLTRFFGRRSELAELHRMIPRARLLTLVGAPGCGKTRLGIELGAQLAPGFRDGAWLVELASVADPGLVANAVGATLGVREQPGRALAETLIEALTTAELLLILDNCEHLTDAAAGLVRRLVGSCPSVRVLATSRVPLGLPGEQVWRVPPLDLAPAVDLFTDRAVLAAAGFQTDAAGRGAVAEICRRLGGLPLAVELAAAWTRVLSPGQILDRLGDALPLLRSGARAAGPRQETMEATVGWSYRLLRPAEQSLFDRLSVFTGGFDLAAAQAVAAPGEDVLDGLASLVDNSLVLATPMPAEPMRYRMLEPVRQCGEAWLAARGEERDLSRRRHAEHYLEVAQRWDAALRGDQRAAALRRLIRDEANLRQAYDWARGRCPELGLRLCAALAHFWELRGRVNDGRARLDEVLADDTIDRRVRATGLSRAGRLAWRQRDYSQARARFEESLSIVRELGDQLAVARRLRGLALVAMSEGDPGTAVQLCERSVATFRAHGDEQGLAWALIYLGWARYVHGEVARGDAHMREALAVNQAAGSVAARVNAHIGLAYGAVVAEDLRAERAHVVDALTALREVGGVVEEPDWLWASCALAAGEGRIRSAYRLAGAAEALGRRGGSLLNEQFEAPIERLLERAGHRLGRAEADRLKAEGARMALPALLAEALAEPGAETGPPLTAREREIAGLVARGLTNVEIARELFISKRTVESHVDHIKQKLGAGTRNQVMAWGLRELPEVRGP